MNVQARAVSKQTMFLAATVVLPFVLLDLTELPTSNQAALGLSEFGR